jgi:putative flippase GtrA
VRRFSTFTVISGLGWLIDVGLTFALVEMGLRTFVASMLGSLAAVSFVFAASRALVFDARAGARAAFADYAPYLVWHGATIPLWSGAVAAVAAFGLEASAGLLGVAAGRIPVPTPEAFAAAFAKVAITPLTLTTNYFFTLWLVERRRRD